MKATEIASLLTKASSVAIVSHTNPDGDAIGSSLALGMALQQKGKSVWLLGDEPMPDAFRFLPGQHLYREAAADVSAEVVVYLDCASRERAANHPARYDVSVNIDHHADNTGFADHNWVEQEAAATGELVYELIERLGIPVDKDMATCLYAAIASDTGWFAYENTRARTHQTAAQLLHAGVESHLIASRLQLGRQYPALKLLGCALLSMELAWEGKVAVMMLKSSDYQRLGAHLEDANGIVQYGGMLRDVEVSVLLKELEPSVVSVSFRSFGEVNVQAIASQLGGGGHIKASGCTIQTDLDAARTQVLEVIGEVLRKHE